MIWNKEMECADRSTMRVLQLKKLKATVKHVYDNVEHYRKKMDEAGVKPEDIQSLDDITKLPFVTKEDIAENYPTGLFAVPMKDIVRVHASSDIQGTIWTCGASALPEVLQWQAPTRIPLSMFHTDTDFSQAAWEHISVLRP